MGLELLALAFNISAISISILALVGLRTLAREVRVGGNSMKNWRTACITDNIILTARIDDLREDVSSLGRRLTQNDLDIIKLQTNLGGVTLSLPRKADDKKVEKAKKIPQKKTPPTQNDEEDVQEFDAPKYEVPQAPPAKSVGSSRRGNPTGSIRI